MSALGSTRDAVLMLRVPGAAASVHYRVYAQSIRHGTTVLEWILAALQTRVPAATRLVCVCDRDAELKHLVAATRGASPSVSFICLPGQNEIRQSRAVMEEYKASRLLVAGFSHAIAPERMLRDLYQLHMGCQAGLTEAVGGTFTDACYVIEVALVDRLLTTTFHRPALTTLEAAALLREQAAARGKRELDFLWIRSDVAKRYRTTPDRWPEAIAAASARDVETIRHMLGDGSDLDRSETELGSIDGWKRASIHLRRRRLALDTEQHFKPAPPPTRHRARVLYACHMSSFTGAQQSLCHLISALDRSRFEPYALVSYEGTFTNELRRRGVEVICPNHSISKNDPENLVFARAFIAAYTPTLIHANHAIGMPLIGAAGAAGVPLVQHVRIPNLSSLREHIVAADAVIAVSHFIRQQIASLDVDLGKVHVIWNGVLPDEFKRHPLERGPLRARLGIPPTEFVVTMIARMARSKRHDSVIQAVSHLRRATGRGYLLLVGDYDGDLSYTQEIETLIKKEELAPFMMRIQFVPDVRPILYSSDALVLPSEDEPLGRAVLEGMAVGLPVVVGESGGSKEVIDAGIDGLVVPSGDSLQLSRVLSELAQNPEWARRIGTAAALKVQTSLTAAICASKTAEVYERVLATRNVKTSHERLGSTRPSNGGIA